MSHTQSICKTMENNSFILPYEKSILPGIASLRYQKTNIFPKPSVKILIHRSGCSLRLEWYFPQSLSFFPFTLPVSLFPRSKIYIILYEDIVGRQASLFVYSVRLLFKIGVLASLPSPALPLINNGSKNCPSKNKFTLSLWKKWTE